MTQTKKHYVEIDVLKGIAIAMENPDENHIYFACIKISGSFKSTAQ